MKVVLQKFKTLLVGLSFARSRLSTDYHCLVSFCLPHVTQNLRSYRVNMRLELSLIQIYVSAVLFQVDQILAVKLLDLIYVVHGNVVVRIDRNDRVLYESVDLHVAEPKPQSFEYLGLIDQIVVHEVDLVAAELVVGGIPLKHFIFFGLCVVAILKYADYDVSVDGLNVCLEEVVVFDDPCGFFGR
jgi:hypothetical protein